MFLGIDIELVSREDSLEFLDLLDTAGTKRDTGLLVELMS